MASELYNVARR